MLYMAVIGLLLGRGSCFQSETLSLDWVGFSRRGIT